MWVEMSYGKDGVSLPGAMHAFRHGNATALGGLNAPMKVRQERLGHVDLNTTMNYTHLVGADDRRISAELGNLFFAQICSNSGTETETAQGAHSQAVYFQQNFGCGGWI
jgi:hypothetical protein